ncbi:MAG: radical SAM protein [Oscillospiraceae bacterium]|nr:radical SAM protein [Oscillospiraceae bacterium]
MDLIPAKNIVIKTKRPAEWFGTDYNMNIYRGCSHGCIYCDSRSTCYGNTEFDKIKVKEDALRIIRDDLRRKVRSGVVGTGAMSDPYNPLERKLKLTRNALELINAYQFGAAIVTKSALVTRDADILQDIKRHSPVIVKLTITTDDDGLSQKIEPNAPCSSSRFAALKELSARGIYCGVLMMPILPFISDTEDSITGIVRLAKEAGAKFIYPAFGMTLRDGNREYYYQKLDELYPSLKEKYISRYGLRYNCTSPNAKKLWEAFVSECEKQEIIYSMKSITFQYKQGYEAQLSLF